MLRRECIKDITNALAILSRKVELNTSVNLTDLNVHAEDFFKDFLNLVCGWSLENINITDSNAAAIDLGDKAARVAIQVTSDGKLAKTRKTVDSFMEKQLFKDYDRLIMLNIVKAAAHKDPKVGLSGVFELDTKSDIWDSRTLVKKLLGEKTEKLLEIRDFLNFELALKSSGHIPKEVNTIVTLIDFLSNNELNDLGVGLVDEPDPEGKIYRRFTEHSQFLTDNYVDLYGVYGLVNGSIREHTEIGTVDVNKKSLYLKSFSDRVLTECNGDPQSAMQKMTEFFSKILAERGVEYDETAIRFFILDELIRCNVFPNKAVSQND